MKRKQARHQLRHAANERESITGQKLLRAVGAIVFFELWLVLEHFQLAWRAAHVEVNHSVRLGYFAEASSASFWQSTRYGLEILWLLARFCLHRAGINHQRQFDSLARRYQGKADAAPAGAEYAKPPRQNP
jgi:hypothetical protein